MRHQVSKLAVIICILGTAFYMFEFTLQVSIGVMTAELMQDLTLNAATLGLISSCFYYGYTPMQIPAGLLHDRYGPHRVLTIAILFCSIGALFFSYSSNTFNAALGRFLIGVGSAFSFSGALLLISRWFPVNYFSVLSGIVQFMSSIGAIFGGFVLALTVEKFGWRWTMFNLGLSGLVLAIAVFLIVRDYPPHFLQLNHQSHTNNHMQSDLKQVFGNSQLWWIALYSFLVWTPIAALAGLWGVPFLVASYHISTTSASLAFSALWIGIGLSSPAIGWISERIERRCIVLITCSFLGLLATILFIYFSFPMYIVYILLFTIGVAGSTQSLAFALVHDINPLNVMGAAIGLNNMATVAGGAIVQPLVGFLLHSHKMINHTPVYTVSDYHFALLMIPLCYLFATIISAKFIQETYCKPLYELK